MTGFELHRTHRDINKINHIDRQIAEKLGKKSASLQPVATRLPTPLIRLSPKTMSPEHLSLAHSFTDISPPCRFLLRGASDRSTSDNLTPQETKSQQGGTVGAGGAGLSCRGSSLVADNGWDS